MYNAEVVEHKQRLATATTSAAAARGEEESQDVENPVCSATPSWVAGGEEPWDVRNAVRLTRPLWLPSSPLTFVQKSLIRESENMVRDTATRLERATGELSDLVVR